MASGVLPVGGDRYFGNNEKWLIWHGISRRKKQAKSST
jgi:hypothetical protein